MLALARAYLFLLGLTSGLTLLTLTAYRRISPRWLRVLLISTGLFVISRYATLALLTSAEAAQHVWGLRYCWLATSVGLTLPSVFAIDQLLRHPAMSPQKLLLWFSPFLVAYAATILCATITPAPDRIVGVTLHLSPGWQLFLAVVQTIFVIGFLGLCTWLIRKVRSRPIRVAVLGLAVGHGWLAVDGLIVALGGWYFRPFLFSEMFTLLAIWYAYETSTSLQQAS